MLPGLWSNKNLIKTGRLLSVSSVEGGDHAKHDDEVKDLIKVQPHIGSKRFMLVHIYISFLGETQIAHFYSGIFLQ